MEIWKEWSLDLCCSSMYAMIREMSKAAKSVSQKMNEVCTDFQETVFPAIKESLNANKCVSPEETGSSIDYKEGVDHELHRKDGSVINVGSRICYQDHATFTVTRKVDPKSDKKAEYRKRMTEYENNLLTVDYVFQAYMAGHQEELINVAYCRAEEFYEFIAEGDESDEYYRDEDGFQRAKDGDFWTQKKNKDEEFLCVSWIDLLESDRVPSLHIINKTHTGKPISPDYDHVAETS